MKIKKLFLLRHADYEGRADDPSLSALGKAEARRLGIKLYNDVGSENVVILTSTAARAFETAQIIKEEQVMAEVVPLAKLWSDNKHRQDFPWLKEYLDTMRAPIVVIVSHLEYVRQFPVLLGFDANGAGYAQGVLIENGICTRF